METEATSEKVEEEESVVVDPATLKPDLFAAAAANDIAKLQEFLDRDVPSTFIDTRNDMTALHWAAIFGNANMMKVLLKK
jgi:ankyrin repeat protein